MRAPDTLAGLLTERVMAEVQRRCHFSTHVYNQAWSGVLQALSEHFADEARMMANARAQYDLQWRSRKEDAHG